jgi:SNF2 family DNA or RNA helicase
LTRSEGIFEALKRGKYDLVILDEAHYLKNNEAQRTQQVFGEAGLRSECGYVLGLTGTPLPNRPRECYTLARGICWDSIDWQDEEEFRDKYNPSFFNGKFAREVAGRTPELNSRLRSHFMVRRLKRDVQKQLPKVSHAIIHIEPDGAIRQALQAEAMLDLSEDMINKGTIPPGMISTVRKEMGLALAPHIAAYVDMIMDGGEQKVFLAGWHKEVLDIWERALHKRGTVRIDGKTSPARKQLAVNTFINDPKCGVIIGNLMSAGVGIDGLQKVCSRLIVGEPDWVPGNNEQVVARLDRIGQELPVLAEYMVAPGSLSERVLSSSLEKMQDIHAALDEEI